MEIEQDEMEDEDEQARLEELDHALSRIGLKTEVDPPEVDDEYE